MWSLWLETHSVHQVEFSWKKQTSWPFDEEWPTDQLIIELPHISIILYCIENYGTPSHLFDSFIRIPKTAPKLRTTFNWNKIPKIDTASTLTVTSTFCSPKVIPSYLRQFDICTLELHGFGFLDLDLESFNSSALGTLEKQPCIQTPAEPLY